MSRAYDWLLSARRVGRGLAGVILNHNGQRRAAIRSLVFRSLSSVTPVIAVDQDELRFFVDTADHGVGRSMYSRGLLETRALAATLEAAKHLYGRDPAEHYFVDVGANIGTASVLAIRQHGFRGALAVEPEPANVTLLRANFATNGLGDACRVVVAAAGEINGQRELELSADNFGDHRVRVLPADRSGRYREEVRATRTVSVRTLDSILAAENLAAADVGLLWIDVQGYETQVLRGAESVLREDVPVVIEFWPYGLRRAGGVGPLCDLLECHFRTFLDLRRAPTDGQDVRLQPICRLRSFKPSESGRTDHTDLLLVH